MREGNVWKKLTSLIGANSSAAASCDYLTSPDADAQESYRSSSFLHTHKREDVSEQLFKSKP